jgi:hypothetical protein
MEDGLSTHMPGRSATWGGADDEGRAARADRLLLAVLTAAVLLVAILTIAPWPVGAFEDDAIYTVLAKSLATGAGYRMINLPGAPHATHYPPGYPLVLALLWRVYPTFPDNIVLFKFANAAFLALAASFTFRFARIRLALSRPIAATVAIVGTLSIVVLLVTGVVLSEPLFMALLLGALSLTESSAESGHLGRAFTSGLLLGALALVRTLGAVAIPAALLVMLLRRHYKAAVALGVAAALLLVPWQLWVQAYQYEIPTLLTGKYGAYGPWLADAYREGGSAFARAVVAINARRLEGVFGYVFMPVTPAWPRLLTFVALAGLTVAGLLRIVRRNPVTTGFVALYMAVVLLWPFEPDRFLLAIWPVLALLSAVAIRDLWRWSPSATLRRVMRAVPLVASAVVVIGFTVYNVRGYRHQWWASVQRDAGRDAKPIAEWVVRHTAMTDVLSTEHDLIVYLYTGRQAIPTSTFLARERVRPLSPEEDATTVRALLEMYRVRYYITAWGPAIRTANRLAALQPPVLRPAGNTSNALVFERISP